MTAGDLDVRPFATPADYAAMIRYFLDGGEAFQRGMGVDPDRLPSRRDWLDAALADHARPDTEKERFFLAWLRAGEVVGHSSISHIVFGDTAHAHLHLWQPALRGSGLGCRFLELSIDAYFERFELRSVASEPLADNPAPNRVLARLGFRLVKSYRTTPTGISFEQKVNRYVIGRDEWKRRHGVAGSA